MTISIFYFAKSRSVRPKVAERPSEHEELTLLLETLGWRAPDGAEARDCPRAKRNWNATDR